MLGVCGRGDPGSADTREMVVSERLSDGKKKRKGLGCVPHYPERVKRARVTAMFRCLVRLDSSNVWW